jgi:hypothetical protein
MEPVFMVLGQSAATAAGIAIDKQADIQNISYLKFREKLLEDQQLLDWNIEPTVSQNLKY